MRRDPLRLATPAAILRTGGFEAAARELAVTQSAVSQRLKALGAGAGAQLVIRGQPSTGTAVGRRRAAHADQVALLEVRLAGHIAALSPAVSGWR